MPPRALCLVPWINRLVLMPNRSLLNRDRKLIQIVDAALADATRKAGEWLACRPGCTQCCIGVFAINQLDALRLRRGLDELQKTDPDRAKTIRRRAQDATARLAHEFPGDPKTGILSEGYEAVQDFETFGNDEPCPVLDPETGLCDLYGARPMTCRVFGPPVMNEDGLGVCDLCFQGATERQILDCEMKPDPDDLEGQILSRLEKQASNKGQTIIAFALSR